MLDDHELSPRIAQALSRRGLAPELLTLEITETSLMSDPARAKRLLADLAAAGVSISIDDFGSGFSSLMYLKELDIQEIKLDKAFVDGLGGHGREESIVRSVVTLSQGFEIDLVAEGIESRDSLQKLKDLGCTIGQGYSIARPMTADAFAKWWPNWRDMGEKAFAA
jgi:EAL domain-containing protein (putative c-di-GMP-specific phosphodiesterase class I)